MYIIYKLIDTIWELASTHSQQTDAEAQLQRFIDQGILLENLKIEQDKPNE